MLIDTHTHLYFEEFQEDRDEVIKRAKESGVAMMFVIGLDGATSKKAVDLAWAHHDVYAVVGVHPCNAETFLKDSEKIFLEIKHMASLDCVVALGEVGLDYYRTEVDPAQQKKCFERFIELAIETQHPLVIHSRDADQDILEMLSYHQPSGLRGVCHCFNGDIALARQILDLGFYLGFDGPLTYPKNHVLREAAAFTPANRLLLETDCPYLPPQSFRGKRNEPSYVRFIFEKLLELRSESKESLESHIEMNVRDLFFTRRKP